MYEGKIAEWERAYQQSGDATAVDFRALVAQSVTTERLTHLLHTYPAKLLPQIPYLFLHSSLADKNSSAELIADPFCGSGTVLLEAVIEGFHVAGADTNPLARLITRVKTHPIAPSKILRTLARVNRSLSHIRYADPPPVVNLALWYREGTVIELAKLRKAINQLRPSRTREFMQVCFSVCARKVSLADPRLSVPVRINLKRKEKYGPHFFQLQAHLKSLKTVSVRERFNEIVLRNVTRMTALHTALPSPPNVKLFSDARGMEEKVRDGVVQLIITSPPYAGAQKYIRTSGLSLGWLDMAYDGELRSLERKTIGREHFTKAEIGTVGRLGIPDADEFLRKTEKVYPLRAHIARVYLTEMEQSLRSMYAMLKPGGHLVMITGPNTICGSYFDTPSFLHFLATRIGFRTKFKLVDHIKSRGLMTKRNRAASIIASESVLCMRKG